MGFLIKNNLYNNVISVINDDTGEERKLTDPEKEIVLEILPQLLESNTRQVYIDKLPAGLKITLARDIIQ